ncbi:MAG: hypothetical protein P8P74_04580 [Crocinitomicaceae bacterium]|nr:hypothetical protein [Crocinitomicaceae bacterium]
MIKESGTWNIAMYIWDENQTEACLQLNGAETYVNWVDASGSNQSTLYHFPTQNECMVCHQSSSTMSPIGPSIRNLNRDVQRNGSTLNQLDHLQALGVLGGANANQEAQIPDYKDVSVALADRGRAYLDMNCAHCHNPSGWDIPAGKDFDFRYEPAFDQTGIESGKDRILTLVQDGEMPFIGVTLSDEIGIALLAEYLQSL